MLQDGNQNAKQQWVQQNAYNKKGNLRKVERERERERELFCATIFITRPQMLMLVCC